MAHSSPLQLAGVALLLGVIGCTSSSRVSRTEPSVSYDSSEDVTRYTSPRIRLVQEVHLTRFPINLTISGGCEGEGSHCRPDDVLWEFVSPPDFAQYLGSDQIDFVVDERYHSFHMDVYHGRVGEAALSHRARFRIPFSFTEQVAGADNVVIKLGGNDIRIDRRRKDMIRAFTEAVQNGV